jgi:hypothetical protein
MEVSLCFSFRGSPLRPSSWGPIAQYILLTYCINAWIDLTNYDFITVLFCLHRWLRCNDTVILLPNFLSTKQVINYLTLTDLCKSIEMTLDCTLDDKCIYWRQRLKLLTFPPFARMPMADLVKYLVSVSGPSFVQIRLLYTFFLYKSI